MNTLLHQDFFSRARQTPEHCAIIEENGQQWTYYELACCATIIKHFILQQQTSLECHYIGIAAPVNFYSIACILGILASGNAYVPLDFHSPEERINKVVDNASPDLIFMDSGLLSRMSYLSANKQLALLGSDTGSEHLPANLISWNQVLASKKTERPVRQILPDDPAYVLHTSGSTGMPKGIVLSHRNATTFVSWMHKTFQPSLNDRVMSRAPLNFDLSVWDIFNSLKSGATLICFDWLKPRSREQRHREYVQRMILEKARFLYTTPSTLIALINHGELLEHSKQLALKTIMYAGEPFPLPYLHKLKEALPETGIANIYGPTETNIITCHWVTDCDLKSQHIPLGKEVDNTEILVVDLQGKRRCAPGEIGELWCRGDTVTLGYLGQPEKNAECRVLSPFHPYPAWFWKTGDQGYRDEQGILHYCGRRDNQMKIKGLRAELGDIESALYHHPAIRQCAVVLNENHGADKKLCCFFSSEEPTIPFGALQNFLKQRLPSAFIPDQYIHCPELPETSTGKIDRVSLINQL